MQTVWWENTPHEIHRPIYMAPTLEYIGKTIWHLLKKIIPSTGIYIVIWVFMDGQTLLIEKFLINTTGTFQLRVNVEHIGVCKEQFFFPRKFTLKV